MLLSQSAQFMQISAHICYKRPVPFMQMGDRMTITCCANLAHTLQMRNKYFAQGHKRIRPVMWFE